MKRAKVKFKILDPLIKDHIPSYATTGSAGIDLRACIKNPLTLHPEKCELIPSGIAIHIENIEIAALVLPRSGLGHKHGIILGNSIGLIDSDYQGQLFISLRNRNQRAFVIDPLSRIAQLVFLPVTQATLVKVDDFVSSARGSGGFGSTGEK